MNDFNYFKLKQIILFLFALFVHGVYAQTDVRLPQKTQLSGENSAFGLDSGAVTRLGFIKKAGFFPILAVDNTTDLIIGKTNQVGIHTNVAGATITEFVTVKNNGNVGIGTINPNTAKLVISGARSTQGIDLSSSDVHANLRVIQNTNSSFDKDLYIGYNSGVTSSLHLYSNNTETVTVKGNNVGIGTINPTAKLEINNGTAGSGLKFTQLNSATAPVIGAAPLGVDVSGNVVTTPGSIFISVTGSPNQAMGAGFNTVSMNTIVNVTGVAVSNYNTATSEFTVPVTGVYEITGSIRYADGSPAGNQFGVGVHTSNADGSWFLWHAIQNTTPSIYRRTSFPYIRVERFTAGQVLRMFSYVDGITMNVANAGMQIRFLF